MRASWAVPVIASILILGTLLPAITLGDAFATHFRGVEASAKISIKGKGSAECKDPSGASSLEGKMKSKFVLKVQNVDGDTATGIAKGKIQVKVESDPGVGVADNCTVSPTFKSKNLQFEMNLVDGVPNQLRITGNFPDPITNNWSLEAIGDDVVLKKKGKFTMELNGRLTNSDGTTISFQASTDGDYT